MVRGRTYILLALSALPCTAAAETVVRLELAERLPFSQTELVEAVRLRLQLEEPGATGTVARVAVRRGGQDVTVELLDYGVKRRVPLLGASGAPAARRVALVIYDLLRDEVALPVPILPASRPASRPAARSPARRAAPRPRPVILPTPAPIAPPGPPLLLLGLLVTAGAGSNVDHASIAATIEGSLRLLPSLRALLGVGPAFVPPFTVDDRSLRLVALPLRVGVAWFPRRGPVELRLLAVAQPYWVRGDGVSHSGVLGGAGTAAFYHLRLAWRLRLLLGAGLDLFFNRTELRLRGVTALATERVAFWGGAALAVRIGR
jgi:hypothetical protein